MEQDSDENTVAPTLRSTEIGKSRPRGSSAKQAKHKHAEGMEYGEEENTEPGEDSDSQLVPPTSTFNKKKQFAPPVEIIDSDDEQPLVQT